MTDTRSRTTDPRDTRLRTADGVELAATVWPPPHADRPTVVIVHGLAASRHEPGVRALARHLAALGWGVVCYDGRGHGASAGHCTLGEEEALDVDAAVRWGRAHSRSVVVVGASMGGIAALRHAVRAEPADGYVVVSSPARWRLPRSARALAASWLTQTRSGRRVADRYLRVAIRPGSPAMPPPVAYAARTTVPVGIVHGRRDPFIPMEEAWQLYTHLGGPRRLRLVDGMGHAFDPRATAAITELIAWAASAPQRTAPTATPAR